MSWDGAGNFNRLFSWVADKAAGLDISSSRMDSDTNNIASVGFGNCITRDGQGQPTANLPMDSFRHTGVQNAVNRTDYAAFGQVQDGLPNWSIAGGGSDALTLALTPALTVLNDGQLIFARAGFANTTTTPTFSPNGLPANVITKQGGVALGIGDIAGALAEIILRYNLANTRWELLNPSNAALNVGIPTTGAVIFTLAPSAPSGWLMFDDTTMGSASSGSAHASAANLALFTILFNGISDTFAPLLTSTGGATTRAGQGSAAAAWAANCRMFLPKVLGRALAVAGSGSGLTSFALGQTVGENNHTLTAGEIPTITSGVSVSVSGSISGNATALGYNSVNTAGGVIGIASGGTNALLPVTGSFSGSGSGSGTSNNTGGGAHNNMQPSSFMNAIVKQ